VNNRRRLNRAELREIKKRNIIGKKSRKEIEIEFSQEIIWKHFN
jgi:hypothetical protein